VLDCFYEYIHVDANNTWTQKFACKIPFIQSLEQLFLSSPTPSGGASREPLNYSILTLSLYGCSCVKTIITYYYS
jgi:hypothetical protein